MYIYIYIYMYSGTKRWRICLGCGFEPRSFSLEEMHIVHCTSLFGSDASYARKMHSRCTTTAGINAFDGGEYTKKRRKQSFLEVNDNSKCL